MQAAAKAHFSWRFTWTQCILQAHMQSQALIKHHKVGIRRSLSEDNEVSCFLKAQTAWQGYREHAKDTQGTTKAGGVGRTTCPSASQMKPEPAPWGIASKLTVKVSRLQHREAVMICGRAVECIEPIRKQLKRTLPGGHVGDEDDRGRVLLKQVDRLLLL